MYSTWKLQATLWSFVDAGVLFAIINRDLPIVRNGYCYAKAALGIIAHHFNVLAIAHDRAWTSGKPILFSVLAAPFVWLSNGNTGSVIASAIGSAFFLWSVALALPRLNRRSGIDPSLMPLQFVLVAFNPLVMYQFWSAYPDSLFAGLVVLAFVLTDFIATEPAPHNRWSIVGLGVTIYLAIHTKLYGAILGLTCPLYLLLQTRQWVRGSRYRGSQIATLAGVWAVLAIVLLTAKRGVNPLLDFADGAGFSDFMKGLVDPNRRNISASVSMMVFALLLNAQFALLFLATRTAWRVWPPAPTVFAGIYLLGLLAFEGTDYNMRYFLPAFPFLTPALVAGARSVGPIRRRAILGAYGAFASFLVLCFNLAPIETMIDPHLVKATARYEHLGSWLDNLRLPAHMVVKKRIDVINADVPLGNVLYWSSNYYGTATHGLAEQLGVKKGLVMRYVLYPSEIPSASEPVFLTEFLSMEPMDRVSEVPQWATAELVRYGLFRLDPISAIKDPADLPN